MVKRKPQTPPTNPKRQVPPSTFDDMPVGSCYICQGLIMDSDEMTVERVDGNVRRRHRQACYSSEVPW